MGKMIIVVGGGISLEDVTATQSDLIKGKTAYLQGQDDPLPGTLELTGNAQAAHVLAGETFYATDPKDKQTGTMTVNSLLSFSCAPYSGRRVLVKWQNPKTASGKPYSGVYIRYSTSGNPGKTGGTQIYKGAGNNTVSEGQSQAYLDLPALSTKYYLSIYPYVTCSAGEMTGAVINATVTTSAVLNKTFTASGSYTIPAGYTKADLFAVGGGGGAVNTYNHGGSYGGSGGYTKTVKSIAVSSGQVLNMTIGAGGVNNANGGATSVTMSGAVLCSADGGSYGKNSYDTGNAGGSGGGQFGPYTDNADHLEGYPGGSDGGDGYPLNTNYTAKGQGTTTRAWGISTGTLYAGGGGGGSELRYYAGGAGGAGGGGTGGSGISGATYQRNGTTNTGGGAGGAGYYSTAEGIGGSGIVLLKLY